MSAQKQAEDITYGDLGDHASVWHDESWGHDQMAIRAKGEVRVHLSPRQFLALLDWGILHRLAIEQLAAEKTLHKVETNLIKVDNDTK